MKPDELLALANEIERGELPPSALDEKFAIALWGGWKHQSDIPQPSPTTNLQDAVDAVQEGWCGTVEFGSEVNYAKIVTGPYCDGERETDGKSRNPAAALCAAILRAKTAEMEGE